MWFSSVLCRSTATRKPTPRGRPALVRPRKFVPALEALEGRDTPSTTVLTVSPNPATAGQAVTLTATVSGGQLQPGTGGIVVGERGSVKFFDGLALLGTVLVAPKSGTTDQGVAQFSTSGLGVGAHSLSAQYSGERDFIANLLHVNGSSTSNPMSEVINPVLPPSPPPPPQIVAVAFRQKGVSRVRVQDAATGAVRAVLTPFRGFGDRLRLQRRDVNGDGAPDLIVQAVIHGKRKQKAFDAVTLGPLPPGLA
jgi:hypothetical protein